MKTIWLKTTSLIIALCAALACTFGALGAFASSGVLSASAAGEPLPATAFPDDIEETLTFSALSDYAVSGDGAYCFAQGAQIIMWKDSTRTVCEAGAAVEKLDYADGKFLCKRADDPVIYELPAPEALPAEFSGTPHTGELQPNPASTLVGTQLGDFNYYTKEEAVYALDKSNDSAPVLLDGYKNAKEYSGKVYVIKTAENALYSLNGVSPEAVTLKYDDYEKLNRISAGDSYSSLTSPENESLVQPKLAVIAAGASRLKINLSVLTSESQYFTPADGTDGNPDPVQSYIHAGATEEQISAIVLCRCGNARIVAVGNDCYLVAEKNAPDSLPLVPASLEKQDGTFPQSTINSDDYAYSSPYVCGATQIFPVFSHDTEAVKAEVKVLSVLRRADCPQLEYDFYLIENSAGKRGYIPSGYITNLDFPPVQEGEANAVPDPAPQSGDLVKTVVLVLVVITLVLAAAGYLVYIATSDKRKKKRGKDENRDND